MERIASYDTTTTDLCCINTSPSPAVAFRDYLRIRLFHVTLILNSFRSWASDTGS